MSDYNKKQIQGLIETYGFEHILKQYNLTLWKVLDLLDDLGYISLEDFDEQY